MTNKKQQNNKTNMTHGIYESYRTHVVCVVLFVLLFSFFVVPQNIAHAGILTRPPTNLGLVGYWPMDEGVGNKVIDASGQNNIGTITGATWTNGKHGKALNFGNGKYVNAGTSDALNMTGDFTSSLWFKTSGQGLNSWGALMGRGTAPYFINPPNKGWFLVSRNVSGTNYIYFQYSGDSLNQQVYWTGGSDDSWHHAVVMRQGNSFSIYIDGVLKNSLTTAVGNMSTPAETFFIGKGRTTDNFIGSLDDVRIYNRALTASEISKLYSSGGVRAKSEPTLVQTASCVISSNACTVNLTLTPGNFVFIAQSGSATNGPYSASDTLGNIYSTANPYNTEGAFTGNNDNQTLYSANIKGGATTITCTRTSNGGGSRCLIMEFSGIAQLSPLDAHAENRNTSSALNSGSITTRFAGDLLIGFFADTGGTYTAGSQYKLPFGSAISVEYKLSSAPGTYSATATHSNSNTAWGSIAAFRPAFQPAKINSSQNNKLTNGLVGLWSFNGADMNWASGTAYDRSGQNNNGTLVNMSTTTSPVVGKLGQALYFDGVDDITTVTSLTSSMLPVSISAWVNVSSADLQSCDGLVFSSGAVSGINIGSCNGGTKVGYSWNNAVNTYGWSGGPLVPINKWFLVTLVVESDKATMYVYSVDGFNSSVNLVSHSASTLSNLKFGADGRYAAPQRYFSGRIDEVRIYNRALSADEVKQLYNMGK